MNFKVHMSSGTLDKVSAVLIFSHCSSPFFFFQSTAKMEVINLFTVDEGEKGGNSMYWWMKHMHVEQGHKMNWITCKHVPCNPQDIVKAVGPKTPPLPVNPSTNWLPYDLLTFLPARAPLNNWMFNYLM